MTAINKEKLFLTSFELRPAELPGGQGLSPRGLILGGGQRALEIAVYDAETRPRADAIRKIWKDRQANRAISLLIIVLYGDKCALCGHAESARQAPPAYYDLDPFYIERLCATALNLPDHHAVDRFLREQIPEAESVIFGIRNQGLLATYVLQKGQEEFDSPVWTRATEWAAKARTSRDHSLMAGLGFSIEALAGPASILTARGSRMALAVFLDQTETAEIPTKRFGGQTPIAYAMNVAQSHNLSWVIVARGPELRLYPTAPNVGVGRRGLTDTYLQVNTDLLTDDRLAYLWLAFSAEALTENGTLDRLLEKSDRYAISIGERLRARIYELVIPTLAKSIVKARRLKKPTAKDLDVTYQMAMLTLFRLLFIAYAEDHDLLPYKTNEAYRFRSLTSCARELKRIRQSGAKFDKGTSRWGEMVILWEAIRKGNSEWGVPPYDGGLFDDDSADHAAGAEMAKIKLSNQDFGHILSYLLLDEGTPEGLGPVDFRALGVREFGTIYEGLLENEMSVADSPLVVDKKGAYKPADDANKAKVAKDEIYLHTRSGARKATGSYYTKSFAVDHLLNQSLEPALTEHLEKVAALARTDPKAAAGRLFEFYVADIAMGSGHFLISAIDRIEKRFLTFLSSTPLPAVDAELDKLRKVIRQKMGDTVEESWLEPNKLLRRLIARRCIYGVDLNPLAVELARLSVWIHTFVPGLPLSFLDHNLVQGNSLVGIATFEEAMDEILEKGETPSLFDDPIKQLLGAAMTDIRKLRSLSDAEIAEIDDARQAHAHALQTLTGARALFDIITAKRLNPKIVKSMGAGIPGMLTNLKKLDHLFGDALHRKAKEETAAIPPFHFPIAFPEVFLRDTPGFDVIIGNPPWEKAHVEEHAFWARYFPGLRGMSQTDQEILKKNYRRERPDLVEQLKKETDQADLLRKTLMSGPYPGMGAGHPDLYKAFCWRFWHLVCKPGGRIGVVLPRSVWLATGSEKFRIIVLQKGCLNNLTYLLNSAGWVFDDAEHRYTIALSSINKTEAVPEKAEVRLHGAYRNLNAFHTGTSSPPVTFAVKNILRWTDGASLPLLPSEESGEVFLQLRKSPRLNANISGWSCRPVQGDVNATADKRLMTLTSHQPKGYWPVYKGESFNIWNPDTGKYYAWVDPEKICGHLQKKREHSSHIKSSVFSLFSQEWVKDPTTLPCRHSRIAFRDVARATDKRTIIAALVPPDVVLTHKGPYIVFFSGDQSDMAFLLGVLSSLAFDWYARCFIEDNVSFDILMPMPVPRPARSERLWKQTVALAGRLACPDKRFAPWAKAVGVKCGPLPDDEKEDMIHELDAVVAHLYGLNEKQLRHIFETFHVGWDYESRLKATLIHFREWRKKL